MFYNTKKICVKQITQIFFKLLLTKVSQVKIHKRDLT